MTLPASTTSPRPGTEPDPATSGRARRAAPWRSRVLTALAQYPDGTCISRLTWKLADGTCGYESLYRRIYRALRGCEAHGHARRAGHQRTRGPTAWSRDITLRIGQLPVIWQVTPAGTAFLAQPHELHELHDQQPGGPVLMPGIATPSHERPAAAGAVTCQPQDREVPSTCGRGHLTEMTGL